MRTLPPCPQCHDTFTYEDGTLLMCPSCGHEWHPAEAPNAEANGLEAPKVWQDANGHVLQNGDTVTLVKNIRLVEGDHDIDCKIEGFGAMQLKTEFVKKV